MVLKGVMVCGGLIIAIGAQNAFVLKQGLLGRHIHWVALTCFVCDFVLMTVGVLGLGSLLSANRSLSLWLAALGALFLFGYGVRSFYQAWCSTAVLDDASAVAVSGAGAAVVSTLTITLLNPHVYLDTVVIVGGIAGTMLWIEKIQFLIGAWLVSFVWFFALGYGARTLRPLFSNKKAWKVLEVLIACVMWWIAFGLARFVWSGGNVR